MTNAFVPGSEPRKKIWICGACGRTGASRWTVGDESCGLHAVLCWEDSIERNDAGRIVAALAVPDSEMTKEDRRQ